jgi:hypothetical protein
MRLFTLKKVILLILPLLTIILLFVVPVSSQKSLLAVNDLANPAWILAYSSQKSKVGVTLIERPDLGLVTIKTLNANHCFNFMYIQTWRKIEEVITASKVYISISVVLPESETETVSIGFSYIFEHKHYHLLLATINATKEIKTLELLLDTSKIESVFGPIQDSYVQFQINLDGEIQEISIGISVSYNKIISFGRFIFSNYWSLAIFFGIVSLHYKKTGFRWLCILALALTLTAFLMHFFNYHVTLLFESHPGIDPFYRPIFDAGIYLTFLLLLFNEAKRFAQ